MHKRSIVMTAAVPAAETDAELFRTLAARYRVRGADVIEFFCPEEEIAARAETLRSLGLSGIYLLGAMQKRTRSSLCALDEAERQAAVERAAGLANAAARAGLRRALFTSGWYPENPADEGLAYAALAKSLRELAAAVPEDLELLLEPGDRDVQYHQLLGPTGELVFFLTELNIPNLRLTMDLSHIAQLGEEPRASFTLAKPFCSHIHLANCILKRDNPMYGDRHPLFGVPDGEFSTDDAAEILAWLGELYADEALTVSVEFINHNASDTFLDEIDQNTAWFFCT